jgi:hypothetical protein
VERALGRWVVPEGSSGLEKGCAIPVDVAAAGELGVGVEEMKRRGLY